MKLTPVKPFEPVSSSSLPSGDQWVAQVKWDGVRMLTYYDGEETRLINRRLNDRSAQYPEFMNPFQYCSGDSYILDGEMIAFDGPIPSFYQIMKRDQLRKPSSITHAVAHTPVTYMIYDLLYLNGQWMIDQPLVKRYLKLEEILSPQPNVQLVQNATDANALFEVMESYNMEGIVCKDLTSTYLINGKDSRWQKKKTSIDLYAVIGGVTYRGEIVNSLLLGLYDDKGQFIYIGHAGTGKLSQKDWRELTERIEPLMVDVRPFVNQPERHRDAYWVKPHHVVRVQFMEWTPYQTMRHPSIQSFSDIPARECVFT